MIKYGIFSLPGRKALLKNEAEYEVILVDATETPIGSTICESIDGLIGQNLLDQKKGVFSK